MIPILKIVLSVTLCFAFVFVVMMAFYWYFTRKQWKKSGKPPSYEEDIENHEK